MNIDDYSIQDLFAIINIDINDFTIEQLIANLHKTKLNCKGNPTLETFMDKAEDMILSHVQNEGFQSMGQEGEGEEDNDETKEEDEDDEEDDEEDYGEFAKFIGGNVLPQEDSTQQDKITDREQKVSMYEDGEHFQLQQEQIATTDAYTIPVKQDTLNPILKNTITRFINLDSQFLASNYNPTNYTINLSDSVKNVISLAVYSYQIPFSWYTIDAAYCNNCLWIIFPETNTSLEVQVTIPYGNYSSADFVETLNQAFYDAGFTFIDDNDENVLPVLYSNNSGIITLNLRYGEYTDVSGTHRMYDIDTGPATVLFFDPTNQHLCETNDCYGKSNRFINNTLGWIMGFRTNHITVEEQGNKGDAILSLTGTKYIILSIDDFNKNHSNNAIVSINPPDNVIKMPSYYSNDLPMICSNPPRVLPSAPRTITAAQLHTINVAIGSKTVHDFLPSAPTSSDVIAILPVKPFMPNDIGALLIEYSSSLQKYERTYFGPVIIDRISVKLCDDKGNILNLHGTNWCVTLMCTCLYQY